MRNTRFVNTLIGVSLLSVGAMANAVTALVPGGTVHFKGEIVNAACAVSTDSDGQTVNLGQNRTAKFKAIGDYSGSIPFNIKLDDCDTSVSTKASVAFNGNASTTDKNILAASNSAGGTANIASGVGIEISDAQGTVLSPNGAVYSTVQTLNDGVSTLALKARYKATAAAVTAGRADADATFTVKYE